MPGPLQEVTIKWSDGRQTRYFEDQTLREYRNTLNPHEAFTFTDLMLFATMGMVVAVVVEPQQKYQTRTH